MSCPTCYADCRPTVLRAHTQRGYVTIVVREVCPIHGEIQTAPVAMPARPDMRADGK